MLINRAALGSFSRGAVLDPGSLFLVLSFKEVCGVGMELSSLIKDGALWFPERISDLDPSDPTDQRTSAHLYFIKAH